MGDFATTPHPRATGPITLTTLCSTAAAFAPENFVGGDDASEERRSSIDESAMRVS